MTTDFIVRDFDKKHRYTTHGITNLNMKSSGIFLQSHYTASTEVKSLDKVHRVQLGKISK